LLIRVPSATPSKSTNVPPVKKGVVDWIGVAKTVPTLNASVKNATRKTPANLFMILPPCSIVPSAVPPTLEPHEGINSS
jgi:hypothetical protein